MSSSNPLFGLSRQTDTYIFLKVYNIYKHTQALFIWSQVPETTLPPSSPGRANVQLVSFQNSTNRLHQLGTRTRLGGRDNSGGRVVSLRQVGQPWQAGQLFFSYKRFRSPNWDNSQLGECHVMLDFGIKQKFESKKGKLTRQSTL